MSKTAKRPLMRALKNKFYSEAAHTVGEGAERRSYLLRADWEFKGKMRDWRKGGRGVREVKLQRVVPCECC